MSSSHVEGQAHQSEHEVNNVRQGQVHAQAQPSLCNPASSPCANHNNHQSCPRCQPSNREMSLMLAVPDTSDVSGIQEDLLDSPTFLAELGNNPILITNLTNNTQFNNDITNNIINDPAFIADLIDIIVADTDLVNQLADAIISDPGFISGLATDAAFVAQLIASLTGNAAFMASIIASLMADPSFITNLANNASFITQLTTNPAFIQSLTTNPQLINALVAIISADQAFITSIATNTGFVTALVGNPAFLALLAGNQTLIDQLIASISADPAFVAMLIASITSDPSFVDMLVTNITNNPNFINSIVTNPDFIAALLANTSFINQLSVLIAGNATFVGALTANQSFVNALTTSLFANQGFLNQLVTYLTTSQAFINALVLSPVFIDQLGPALAGNTMFISSLTNSQPFITQMGAALGNNASFLTQIGNSLISNAAFITNLANNGPFLTQLGGNLATNNAFVTALLGNGAFTSQIATIVIADPTFVPLLFANPLFIPQLITILTTNNSFVTAIALATAGNDDFITSLVNNGSFIQQLGTILANNPNFYNLLAANAGFILTIANSSAFVTALVANPAFMSPLLLSLSSQLPANAAFVGNMIQSVAFTTGMANNPNFSTTLAANPAFASALTTNFTFVADITAVLASSLFGDPLFLSNLVDMIELYAPGGGSTAISPRRTAFVAPAWTSVPPTPSVGSPYFSSLLSAVTFVNAQPATEIWAIVLYPGFYSNTTNTFLVDGTMSESQSDAVKSIVDEISGYSNALQKIGKEVEQVMSEYMTSVQRRCDSFGAARYESIQISAGEVHSKSFDMFDTTPIPALVPAKLDLQVSPIRSACLSAGAAAEAGLVTRSIHTMPVSSRKKTMDVKKINTTCSDADNALSTWKSKFVAKPSALFPKGVRVGDVCDGSFSKVVDSIKNQIHSKMHAACDSFSKLVSEIAAEFSAVAAAALKAADPESSLNSNSHVQPKAFSAPPAISIRPGTHITAFTPGTVIVDYDITWTTATASPSYPYNSATNIVTGIQFSHLSVLTVDLSGGNGQNVVFDNCRCLSGTIAGQIALTVLGTGLGVRENSTFQWVNSSLSMLTSFNASTFSGTVNFKNLNSFQIVGATTFGKASSVNFAACSNMTFATTSIGDGCDFNTSFSTLVFTATPTVGASTTPMNIATIASSVTNPPPSNANLTSTVYYEASMVSLTSAYNFGTTQTLTISNSYMSSAVLAVVTMSVQNLQISNSVTRALDFNVAPPGNAALVATITNSALLSLPANTGGSLVFTGTTTSIYNLTLTMAQVYLRAFTLQAQDQASAVPSATLTFSSCYFANTAAFIRRNTSIFAYGCTFQAGQFQVGIVGTNSIPNIVLRAESCSFLAPIVYLPATSSGTFGPANARISLTNSSFLSLSTSNGSGMQVLIHGCSQTNASGAMLMDNPSLILNVSGSFSDQGSPSDLIVGTNTTTTTTLNVTLDSSSFRTVTITPIGPALANPPVVLSINKSTFYGAFNASNNVKYVILSSSFLGAATVGSGIAGDVVSIADCTFGVLNLGKATPAPGGAASVTRCNIVTLNDLLPAAKDIITCVIGTYTWLVPSSNTGYLPTRLTQCVVDRLDTVLNTNHTLKYCTVKLMYGGQPSVPTIKNVLNIMSCIMDDVFLSGNGLAAEFLLYMTDSTVNGHFTSFALPMGASGLPPSPIQDGATSTFPYTYQGAGPAVITYNKIGFLTIQWNSTITQSYWNFVGNNVRVGNLGISSNKLVLGVQASSNFLTAWTVAPAVTQVPVNATPGGPSQQI